MSPVKQSFKKEGQLSVKSKVTVGAYNNGLQQKRISVQIFALTISHMPC